MKSLNKRLPLLLLCLLAATSSLAQESAVLESYLLQGLQQNLALQQQENNLAQQVLRQQEANSLLLPSSSLEVGYTAAAGGRRIDLPIGDLLNPVYTTLNQMLEAQGQQGTFPQVENQETQFFPTNFHDTKIRTVHPLYNAAIYRNREISGYQYQMAHAETQVAKRQLVADIKTAYFQYMQAQEAVKVYQSARAATAENLRVTKSLIANQMATKASRLRIESSLQTLDYQIAEAQNNARMAQHYFNFLLNKPQDSPITPDASLAQYSLNASISQQLGTLTKREEVEQLNYGLKALQTQQKMASQYWLPQVNHVLDLGFQGEVDNISSDQAYAFYNISLSMNLFRGNQNRLTMQRTQLASEQLSIRQQELDAQIVLQVNNARHALATAQEALVSAQRSLSSANEYYRVVQQTYKEGLSPLVELTDAQEQQTRAQLQGVIANYQVLMRMAELERVAGTYPLESLTARLAQEEE